MKKLYLLLVILMINLCLVSCEDKEEKEVKLKDFYTNAEYVYVDYTHELLTFEMMLLTDEVVEDIQVTEVKGDGVLLSDFDITVTDNSIESIKDFTYKDLHPSVWYFNFQLISDKEKVKIDGITLSVNGKEHEVNFGDNVNIENGDGTKFSGNMQPGVIPTEFPGSMINGELTPTYTFTVLEDVSIDKVYSKEEIIPTIEAMMVNGLETEKPKLPIALKKGDSVELNIGFDSEKLSKYNYILTDFYVEYSMDSETDYFKSLIMVSPIYPINDNDLTPLKEYIELIIGDK